MNYEKCRLLNGAMSWRLCSGVTRGCVPSIRLGPPRRDDRAGVLIGADGMRRSDWPKRLKACEVSARIDR